MVQKRTDPSNSLGILLAGLLRVERSADRWEIARAPRTTARMRRGVLVLVPKRWN